MWYISHLCVNCSVTFDAEVITQARDVVILEVLQLENLKRNLFGYGQMEFYSYSIAVHKIFTCLCVSFNYFLYNKWKIQTN